MVHRPPYGAVVRLFALLSERYGEIEAAYYQVDLLRVGPRKLLNMVYAWAVERVPADKLEEWEQDLVDLLPWQDATTEAAVNIESESFMNMMHKGG